MSFCSISGNTCEDPVVSKSGYIFERRLVEKHIQANGTCPVTGDPLTVDDLIKVNTNASVKPRPVTATSIPGMLQLFQNEWDSLMLETSVLRKHLQEAREQLSDALYENDAATRVIARLISERDEARKELADVKGGKVPVKVAAAAKGNDAMEIDQQGGLSEEIVNKMNARSQELAKYRKKRPVSDSLKAVEDISKFSSASTHPVHKTSPAGILSVAVNPQNGDEVATGGLDKTVVLFNKSTKKVVQTLSDHTKRVHHVAFHGSKDIIVSCSQDKTCKVWSDDGGKYKVAHNLTGHDDDVVGATIHPTGEYLVTASADKSWAFWDINHGTLVEKVAGDVPYTCVSFHPDGLILGVGDSNNNLSIFDAKTQKNVAGFSGHTGAVTSLAFSENGYYLASASKDNTVKLWDLRKLSNFKTIEMEGSNGVNSVAWDFSGSYLAAAGNDLRVFKSKTWDLLLTADGPKTDMTSVAWGPDASYIAAASMDRNLRFYA